LGNLEIWKFGNFLAIDPAGTNGLADRTIAHLHAGAGHVRYPGERTLEIRRNNMREGVPVDPSIWQDLQTRAAG
jgi:3-dehydro-L-gulonate 2-dehydrogenase